MNKKSEIVLSFVLPVYNGEKYIARTIQSILSQPCDSFELIIINDGSTDNSDQIIRSFLPNGHIKYICTQNGGVSNARNTGINQIEGLYVCFIDQDDVILNGAFSSYLQKKLYEAWKKDIDAIGFLNVTSNESVSRFNTSPVSIESKSNTGKPFMLTGCPIHFSFFSCYLFQEKKVRCFGKYRIIDTDINFTHLLYYNSRKVELWNDIVLYCWCTNTQSVSSNIIDNDIHKKYMSILQCWKDIYYSHKNEHEIDALQYSCEMICNLYAQTLYFYHWLFFAKADWEEKLYNEYKEFISEYKEIYNEHTKMLLNDYFERNVLFRIKARMNYWIVKYSTPLRRSKIYQNKKYPLDISELPI